MGFNSGLKGLKARDDDNEEVHNSNEVKLR